MLVHVRKDGQIIVFPHKTVFVKDGSNMTGTDLYVNKPHKSRSYLNHPVLHKQQTKTKLRGLSPRANYTDRATAASRRS